MTDLLAVKLQRPRLAVIIIEHDMEFVQRIAHKVTVLHLGKILAEGSMADIQHNERVQEVYLGH
jgi:urea transport system ATP-binding protein